MWVGLQPDDSVRYFVGLKPDLQQERNMDKVLNAERQRLEAQRQGKEDWRMWGPYLAERAWGTVREDYSADGTAWDYFPHDLARSRAYRWGEDGMGGVSDVGQNLCMALALWNGNDPIIRNNRPLRDLLQPFKKTSAADGRFQVA